MRRVALCYAWAVAFACGAFGDGAERGGIDSDADTLKGTAAESLLLAEIAPPKPVPGKWVGRTPLRGVLAGVLPVRGGRCLDPPSVQIMARGDSIDALVVVYFEDAQGRPGTYSVVSRDRPSPEAGYARVGVQRVGYLSHSYEGVEGSVELDQLGSSLSGKLEVVLREVNSWEKLRYAAVFSQVKLEVWPEAYCGAPVPPDSVSSLDRPVG